MTRTITYKGETFLSKGVHVDESLTFGEPERDFEYVDVLGRSGSLALDNNRWFDLEVEIPCYINESFPTTYRSFMAWLNASGGWNELETDVEPNHFRMALFTGNVTPTPTQLTQGGFFNLLFRVHPQRYLKTGKTAVTFTANGTINNPTLFDAKPLLRVYGQGDIGIGSETLTLSQAGTAYVDIDCDIMDAFEGATNMNEYLTVTDFPVLKPGNTGITLGAGITKIEVTPRWFEI